MSSNSVREALTYDVSTLFRSLPYVETINILVPKQSNLEDIWCTISYDAAPVRTHVSMGRNPWVVERGIVNLVLFAKSGLGDTPAFENAQEIMHRVDGWRNAKALLPTIDVWFENVYAPRQLEVESNGDWFLVGIPCSYQSQERVTLNPY